MRRPRSAETLVARLRAAGYEVFGQSFEIYRAHGQGMMNKALGEAAPTWELLCDPLVHSLTGRVVAHGTRPRVRLPSGEVRSMEVCSHLPLLHILREPLETWTIDEDDYGRLVIDTARLPLTWG